MIGRQLQAPADAEMKVHLVKATGKPQPRALSAQGRLWTCPEEYLMAEGGALDTLLREESRLKI